uniref:Rhodanese domain-containing protein n=1 Tax=Corethron hystrix TaxID=216773 RepID=A0A7S1FNV1_9STRA|mmetsp:Transcript_19195/g.43720  ORF Transcript_19195/g.43720 Transcript_19195/m.43720 type:complete len:488 (+) Transcript_19195:60-1523(+)|eukprot:CAMPEP_0113303802 /NCGR_PEP_ID=MMETSP0010_2-20120614/4064_1 /TAXON_ID=216773 ORGANISM="Corethron hystrix, Strain 308" /NCGR_SAMPLE_ID=MMETSP0010_2 /ASSEMBLY_ACC=CAM_ASM_000155 /LENGTH=487 /DNA_ID=CAMNT_0000157855 /DNA_START=56 /DNA_END=1519 /DNA_ORIENTATION=- /assembly_acc=CAM_ASM_000155
MSSSSLTPNLPESLTAGQVVRYSRHLLLQKFGSPSRSQDAQLHLLKSSVLILGAGGIGSTAILYLAGAGVGRLGVVDSDVVEIGNLHRQILHGSSSLLAGKKYTPEKKVRSAAMRVAHLNPDDVEVIEHDVVFDATNALDLVCAYDLVVDCSDNPRTRYLASDAAVLCGRTLVSGAAVGTEGQVAVYNFPSIGFETSPERIALGGCYRCLYPLKGGGVLSGDAMGGASCSDAGVLGPVPGIIGALMSVEAIKILLSRSLSDGVCKGQSVGPTLSNQLLMYDAAECGFVKLGRPTGRKCQACCLAAEICLKSKGVQKVPSEPTERMRTAMAKLFYTVEGTRGPSCGTSSCYVSLTNRQWDISPAEYAALMNVKLSEGKDGDIMIKLMKKHVLIDVRSPRQFGMCNLPWAINWPLVDLVATPPIPPKYIYKDMKKNKTAKEMSAMLLTDVLEVITNGCKLPAYVVCRRGIASAKAVTFLRQNCIKGKKK